MRTSLLINLRKRVNKQLINGSIALQLASSANCAISPPALRPGQGARRIRCGRASMLRSTPVEFINRPTSDIEHTTVPVQAAAKPADRLKMDAQDQSAKAGFNRRTSHEEALAIKAEVDYQRLVSTQAK